MYAEKKENFSIFTYVGGQIDDFESEAPSAVSVDKGAPGASVEESAAFFRSKAGFEAMFDECHNHIEQPFIVGNQFCKNC